MAKSTLIVVERNWELIERHVSELDRVQPVSYYTERKRRRRRLFVESLFPYLKVLGIRTVLDVGCSGITTNLWLAKGYDWAGLTFPNEAADLRKKGIVAGVGSIESMPHAQGSFDLVYASHVLEHSCMPIVALRECRRVGRVLVVAVPKWPRLYDDKNHFAAVPLEVWHHWFRLAGWTIGVNMTSRKSGRWILVQDKKHVEPLQAKRKEIVAGIIAERKRLKREKK